MDEHIVEGYYFEDIREANKAKKEYFNICKLKSTISFDDIAGIKKLYVKLVGKKYFTTPIGYAFLQEMREYLVENTGETELPLIGVARTNVVKVPEVIKEKYPEISRGMREWIEEKMKEGDVQDLEKVMYLTITVKAYSYEEARSYFLGIVPVLGNH